MTHKISTYKNPKYVVSFGRDDVVFVDLVLCVEKLGEVPNESFKASITKCQITDEMEFAKFLIFKLSTTSLDEVMKKLESMVLAEVNDNLFSLFYDGDIEKPAS